MATSGTYDLIVIGAGAGGLTASAGGAALGAKTLLVNAEEQLGGDCLLWGCIPSKTLIRSANARHEQGHSDAYGLPPSRPGPVSLRPIHDRIHAAIGAIAPHETADAWRARGVDVVIGTARFTGPRSIDVHGIPYTGRRICIATGSRPLLPPIPGLADVNALTNENVFDLDQLPSSLIILGGGPIGVELGQAFARLGTHVTLVEAKSHVLPSADPEAAGLVAAVLEADGVTIATDATVHRIRGAGDGPVTAHIQTHGNETTVTADRILVAAGRTPNTHGLDLAAARVEVNQAGAIRTDATLRTSARHIAAIGDVNGHLPFTHVAEAEARLAVRNLLFPGRARIDRHVIPWTVFTDPEVAHVGSSEAQVRATGPEPLVYRFDIAAADRAVTDGHHTGLVKLVADRKGRLLGATIAAPHAGELIGSIALAMRHRITLDQLSAHIVPYPTLALAVRQAADQHVKARLGHKGTRRALHLAMRLAGIRGR